MTYAAVVLVRLRSDGRLVRDVIRSHVASGDWMRLTIVDPATTARPPKLTRKAEAAEPPSETVTAVYQGERLIYDQSMQCTVDGVDYQWVISREMPVMTYTIGDDEDVCIATWVPIGAEIVVPWGAEGEPTETVVSGKVSDDTLPTPEETKTVTLGQMAMDALAPAEEQTVTTERGLTLTFRAQIYDVNTGKLYGSRSEARAGDLVPRGGVFTTTNMLVGLAAVAGFHAVRAGARYAMARRAARLAKAGGRKGGSGGRGKGGAGKVKKPHMPGWPAANFRRGRGAARGRKAADDGAVPPAPETPNGTPTIMAIAARAGYAAPFEYAGGTTKLQKSIAMSVVLLNSDELVVWETGDIHVPGEEFPGLLVPQRVQIAAAAVALAAEAQAYVEFLAAEPDLTVEVSLDEISDAPAPAEAT